MLKKRKKWDEFIFITYDEIKELHLKYGELEEMLRADDENARVTADYNRIFEETLEAALQREIFEKSEEHRLEAVKRYVWLEEQFKEQEPRYYRKWYWLFKLFKTRGMQVILNEVINEADELYANAEYKNDVGRKLVEALEKQLEREFYAEYPKEDKRKRRLKRKRRRFDRLKKFFLSDELNEFKKVLEGLHAPEQVTVTAEPVQIKELFPEAPSVAAETCAAPAEEPKAETPPPKKVRSKKIKPAAEKEQKPPAAETENGQLPGQIGIEDLEEKNNAGRDTEGDK